MLIFGGLFKKSPEQFSKVKNMDFDGRWPQLKMNSIENDSMTIAEKLAGLY